MTGMRHIGLTALALAVAVVVGAPPAPAQFMRDHESEGGVRGFHGPRSIGQITRSFARAEFERILSAVGLGYVTDRIALRASAETPNAEAFIGKNGERFIFYNASFMQRVKQRTAEHWSLVSILAHEVGHHVAFHTVEGHDHKFELDAEYFSGFVLKRLGATLDQAQAAIRLISPKDPGPTHPGLEQRLRLIVLGWTDGGAEGAPPGLTAAIDPGPVWRVDLDLWRVPVPKNRRAGSIWQIEVAMRGETAWRTVVQMYLVSASEGRQLAFPLCGWAV